MKSKMHMRSKILLLCLGCTLIALILQTILFQNTSAKLIYHQAEEESFNSLKNMQNDIYSFVKNIESNLIKIYGKKDFLKNLRSDGTTDNLKSNHYRLAYTFATENFDSTDAVLALYVYTDSHDIISTYRRAVTPKHNYEIDIYDNIKEQNAELVKEYAESDDAVMLITSYYNKYRETDIIRFVLKIYNNSNLNDKLGYLVCDIDSKVIRSIMEKYSMSQEVFMWIQPVGDRVMTSIGAVEGNEEKTFLEIASQIETSRDNEVNKLESSKRVIFQYPQSKYNVIAYSLMPKSFLSQNQKTLTRNLVLIAVIMIAAAAMLSTFISKSLTKPLVNLTDTMKRIRHGETLLRAEISNQDEIGELANNFNRMLDEMDTLMRKEYEAKLMLNKAEYRALQAQVNPHFLYNTLDTMSSIAMVQNCMKVSGLSQSLANIFRYSLEMQRPFSTVAQEIVHLKNYIYVMNERMGNEIEYQFEIDNQILQDTLPRITIQPLVENAINHGLRNKHGDKRIMISAKEINHKLEISVEDNGIGMTAENIACIIENKSHEKESEKEHTSIGLANIQSRIQMLYGEESGIKIESEVGEWTKVTITIPRTTMEDVKAWMQD